MRLQLSAVAAACGVWVVVSSAGVATADDDDDWRISTDSLVYSDTDSVIIVSPQVAVQRALDDGGGNASARVVVDIVSAASVDVVSQATPGFTEVREEANLGLAKDIGDILWSGSYRYSHEPDYQSHGVGAGLQRDLGSADTTLALGYNLSLDTVGLSGTPKSVFSERVTSHSATVSLTQVLGTRTLVRGIYTLSVQTGYLEKPYRFVPLFDAAGIAAAEADGVTLDLSTFDRYRLAERPAEEVPDTRVGHAAGVRFMRYIDWLPGSVRLDYQLFGDSWGVLSHTVESTVLWKLNDQNVVGPYGRAYLQQAADFWEREYVVEPGQVPRFRTMDRDLSNYYVVMGGLRYEWTHGLLSAYGEASAMETLYSDYLFLTSRFALVGQAGVRIRL